MTYINAHGTSTPLNDAAESAAIKGVLGDHAHRVAVSSTKSMTGHMLGRRRRRRGRGVRAGHRERRIPPTIHYATPDPDCDLDVTPNEARDLDVTSRCRTRSASAATTPRRVPRDLMDSVLSATRVGGCRPCDVPLGGSRPGGPSPPRCDRAAHPVPSRDRADRDVDRLSRSSGPALPLPAAVVARTRR